MQVIIFQSVGIYIEYNINFLSAFLGECSSKIWETRRNCNEAGLLQQSYLDAIVFDLMFW